MLILWMSKWKDGNTLWTNKKLLQNLQRPQGYLFWTDENKNKKSIPWMGLFCASGTVEILNVHWPFITWRFKRGQVDWWIKLQNIHASEEKDKREVLCWYYIQERKVYYSYRIICCQQYFLTSIYSEYET